MRLKLFLVLIFALPHNYGYSQSYVHVTKGNRGIGYHPFKDGVFYSTVKNGVKNGASILIDDYGVSELYLFDHDRPLFSMCFSDKQQIDFILCDYERIADVEVPTIDVPYIWRCKKTQFYPSGNVSCNYMYRESIVLDYLGDIDGNWFENKDDFGTAMHRKYEVGYNIVHDTLLDGQLNGSQVYLNKETQCLRRINFYELGELKAQFSFNDDGSINEISYCITKNDLTEDFEYKCTLIPFMPDGTMLPSCTLLFDEYPDEGLSRIY